MARQLSRAARTKGHGDKLTRNLFARHPFTSAIGAVVVAVGVLQLVGPTVNGATAAQVLLLVVLIVGRLFGSRPALVASALAFAALVRYFLSHAGFVLGDPNDWAALGAFVIMAVIGGQLATRAERRTKELEHLYQQLQAAFERESEAEASRRNERLKATLLDALTHNLRTPLTSVKAAVTAMIGSQAWTPTSTLTAAEQCELLMVIDEETDRLNRFIGSLSASDAVDPAQPTTIRTVEVETLVSEALARASLLTRDHKVSASIANDLPNVRSDRVSMVEVLYILLDNASKYAPPQTSIRVSAQRHDEHYVAIRVSDEGPGIPAQLRERVFEKFFRIPGRESHDPGRSGAGIGLALARRLVETQGGRIWVENTDSRRGTEIVLLLPAETS